MRAILEAMASGGLQKVRTFASDVQRVHGGATAETPSSQDNTTKKESAVTRPPNTPPSQKKAATTPSTSNTQQHVQDAVTSLSQQVPEQRPSITEAPRSEKQKGGGNDGLQNTADTFITEDSIGDGVIVNDKKRERWTLGKAVAKGVGGWMNEKKQALTALTQDPQPHTAPAQTRANVIQEAGEKGRLAPQDDHEATVERLRTFKQDVSRAQGASPHAQIKKDADTAARWSHTTEPTAEEAVATPSIKKAPPVERATPRTQNPSRSRDKELDTPGYTQKTSEPLRTLRSDTIEEVSEKNLTVPKIAAAARNTDGRNTPATLPRHTTLAPVLVIGTLIFILLGGGATFFFWNNDADVSPGSTVDAPTLIGNVTQIPFALPTNASALTARLAELISQPNASQNTLVQYYPEITTDAGARAATAGQFMGVLNPQAPGNFLRNLQADMAFGAHTRDEHAPFFIFTHTSFDVAFAGMLAWENQLQQDLAPLFGTPTQAAFVDERIENHDVRVLYNAEGEAVVVYGFPQQDTLILTGNHETFRVLMSRVR